MKEYCGKLQANGKKIAIVVARFNEMITQKLLDGAVEGFCRHGGDRENITIAWVPGSFELALVAKQLATSKQYDAIICLGSVIRGATTHYDYVAGQTASGITQVSLETNTPIIFGVLTTETIEQALERAGTKHGNKGFDAVQTAIEMADLMLQFSGSGQQQPNGVASAYTS